MITPFSKTHIYRSTRSGFTLIELLAVLAIMGLLSYCLLIVGPSLYESNTIATAGQMVADELAVARAYAASTNQSVYVRFITNSGSAYKGYSAIQLWQSNPSVPGSYLPVDPAIRLPSGIEISSNSTLSPLVSTLVTGSTGTLPAGVVSGSYVAFSVRPDGNVVVTAPPSTATNAASQMPFYFLTILPVRFDGNSTVPINYITLQVNPDTASVQVFQP